MENHQDLSPEQQKMDAIFDAFFAVSDILREDVSSLLDSKFDENPIWRRAFIRAVAPLIEGLAYSYLSICHINPDLTPEDREKVDPDQKSKTSVRIKTALESIYRQLNISPPPDFSRQDWTDAQRMFSARDSLMHPKTIDCLTYTEDDWKRIYDGSVWLLGEFFRLPDLLGRKFGSEAGIS